MISINATLVIQVVHFLLLVYLLNRIMFRPIMKLIRKRKKYMEETAQRIEKLERKAEKLKHDNRSKEIGARQEAAGRRKKLRSEGILEAKVFADECLQNATVINAEAEERAQEEFTRALPFLDDEAAKLADEIVKWIIGRRTSP